MTFNYFRVAPTAPRSLTPSDLNKPALLLSNVANVAGDFGRNPTASTPTISSPQPQIGAMAGRLTRALLNTFVTGPRETACNSNTLSTTPLAPTGIIIGGSHISIPTADFTGLFSFVAAPNFETLFNVLVILCLLYLFFTLPAGDGAVAGESFGVIDTSLTHDSGLGAPKTPACWLCPNHPAGAANASRPQKTRSGNSVKQPAVLVSSRKSRRRSTIERSPPSRTTPPTTRTESSQVQSASATEPPAKIEPKFNANAAEDMARATRPDAKGIQWWWDMNAPIVSDNSRRTFFPSNSLQTPASSTSTIIADHAGPSELRNKSRNPETVDTFDEAGSKASNDKGKDVPRLVSERRRLVGPPLVGEVVPGEKQLSEPAPRSCLERGPATTPNSDMVPQPRPRPPVLEESAQTQRLALPPTLQQPSTPQPTVNFSFPTVPVGPTHAIVPMAQGPPLVIPVPVQPPTLTAFRMAPPSWLRQQVIIGPNPHFQAQSVTPPSIIALPPHIVQSTCAPVFAEHMDVADADGDTWMRPNGFGEESALPEPAPAPLARTLAIPTENVPQHVRVVRPTRQPTVSLLLGPTLGFLDLNARQLRKKVQASRLPYGFHPRVAPLAPSRNRRIGRLRKGVQPGRGSTSTRSSIRDKNAARASLLEKRSSLHKKLTARPPKLQYLENPSPPRADDPPKVANPTALTDPSFTKKKAHTYFDRLHATRASPFSQRGPSEVSLLACSVVPKPTSLKKAFIWQRHFAARDRRAAGTDGRIYVVYQNDPTIGQQTITGSHRQLAPPQRKAPVGDHIYPRRKRQTAADSIRAEEAEKEKEVIDAAVDALQSMGLNSGASTSTSSSPPSEFDTFASSSTTSSSSVVQDPGFNLDQAQLLLEDILEDCEKNKSGLAVSFSSSSSSSDSSSGSDSESDDH